MKYTTVAKNFVKTCASRLNADRKTIHLDRYAYGLIGIFALVFGYTIFVMNDIGVSVLSTIGVDHASMLESMLKILEFRTFYNQMGAYHSSYYGWTYFFLSFVFLLPIKIISWTVGMNVYLPVYIGLKLLHFIYGTLACLSFYYLAKKFFNQITSFVIAFIFMLGTALTGYNYIFHPEVIGVLFLNLSCIYLFNFIKSDKPNDQKIPLDFWLVLLFLVLATLSKPTFFLTGFPLFLCLLGTYLQRSEQLSIGYLTSKDFAKLIGKSSAFALSVFFVINPFFFIKLPKAINRQLENIAIMSDSPLGISSFQEALQTWFTMITAEPFLVLGIVSAVLLPFYFLLNRKIESRFIYAFMFAMVAADVLFVVTNFRLFLSTTYFIPMLPFLLLGAMAVCVFVTKTIFRKPMIFTVLSSLIALGLAYPKIHANFVELKDFYSYHDKTAYKIYDFISKNIPDHAIIMHDHLVGIPEDKDIKSYHYWQNNDDTLRTEKVDYVIFNPEMKINGKYQDKTLILKDRIKAPGFKMITKIDDIEVWQHTD